MADTLTPDSFMKRQLTPDEFIKQRDSSLANPAIIPALSEDQKPELIDRFRYYVGRHLANALPALGSVAGGSLGARGGKPMLGASLGAAAGSYGSQTARMLAPRAFGSPSQDPNSDAVMQAIGQGIVPEMVGSIGSKIANTAIAGAQGGIPAILQQLMASKLAQRFSPTIKAAREAERVGDQVAKMETFRQLPKETFPASSLATRLESDPSIIEKMRFNDLSRNQRAAASFEDTNKLIKKGYSPSTGKIDAPKILDDLEHNAKDYANIDPMVRDNLRTFLKEVQASKSLDPKIHPVLRYAANRMIFTIPAFAVGSATSSMYAGVAAGSAIVLTEKAISKMMSNPETSSLVLKAIKTPMSDPAAPLIGALLKNALRGQEVILTTSEDKNQRAVVGPGGELQYPQPNQK